MVRIMHWLGQNKSVPRLHAQRTFSLVDLGIIFSCHRSRR